MMNRIYDSDRRAVYIGNAESQGVAGVSSEIERFQYRFHSPGWVFYVFLALSFVSYFGPESIDDWLCAIVVEIGAFVSIFVWARKGVLGMPIMPVFACLSLVYYGMPFVTNHPMVFEYEFPEKLFAAATVSFLLILMTIAWALIAKPTPPREWTVRALLPERGAIGVLLGCLIAGIAFQSNVIFLVYTPSNEIYGVIRAVLLTLGLLSIFSMSYLLGAGALRPTIQYLFYALAAVFVAYHAISLYLIGSAQYLLAATFGFFLGSGRVPWKWLIAVLAVFTVLQAGKGDTRVRLSEGWGGGISVLTNYGLLQSWFLTGIANLAGQRESNDQEVVPLAQRTSLIHILLKTQTEAPDIVPYLNGSTYIQIPLLVVPRVVWADRPNTSETLVQLNEHYGLLTREEAESTSIGWGMFAEANANFGFPGCVAVAIFLGAMLGVAQRTCGRFPVLSARGMAGLLVMYTMLNMEASMAQLITILAQSFVPLALLTWLVMRKTRIVV